MGENMGCCNSRGTNEQSPENMDCYNLLLSDDDSIMLSTQPMQYQYVIQSNEPLDQDADANKTQQLFETLLLQLENACLWTKSYDVNDFAVAEQLKVKLIDVLEKAADVNSKLSGSGRSSEADKLVACIVNLRNSLGGTFFDSAQIYAFTREKIEFGKYLITVGQYFRPVMLSEDEDSVLKLFFFRVTETETGEVIHRYYLEHCSFIDDEYFALGLGKDNGHTQIDIYGSYCPSYWKVRGDVLRDLKTRESSLVEEAIFPETN